MLKSFRSNSWNAKKNNKVVPTQLNLTQSPKQKEIKVQNFKKAKLLQSQYHINRNKDNLQQKKKQIKEHNYDKIEDFSNKFNQKLKINDNEEDDINLLDLVDELQSKIQLERYSRFNSEQIYDFLIKTQNDNLLQQNKDYSQKHLDREFQLAWEQYQLMYNDIIENDTSFYLKVSIMNEHELIQKLQNDGYPFFHIRKYLKLYKALISHYCDIISRNALFETIVIIVILFNSYKLIIFRFIMISQQDNSDIQFYEALDQFFVYFYLSEGLIKIFAYGLKYIIIRFILNKNSYLSDNWNIMDFIIIVTSLLQKISKSFDLNSLRVLRVLRPLKSVSKIKSLKKMVNTLFTSFKMLSNILVIILFFLVVFAIVGLQIFQGEFKNICIDFQTGIQSLILGQYVRCASDQYCQATTGQELVCAKYINNPQFGFLNYDQFFYSFIIIFQTCTLEGWTQVMIFNQQTSGFSIASFNVFIAFFGSFVLINLLLAIVAIRFLQSQIEDNEEEQVLETNWNFNICKELQLLKKPKQEDIKMRNCFDLIKEIYNSQFFVKKKIIKTNNRHDDIFDLGSFKQSFKKTLDNKSESFKDSMSSEMRQNIIKMNNKINDISISNSKSIKRQISTISERHQNFEVQNDNKPIEENQILPIKENQIQPIYSQNIENKFESKKIKRLKTQGYELQMHSKQLKKQEENQQSIQIDQFIKITKKYRSSNKIIEEQINEEQNQDEFNKKKQSKEDLNYEETQHIKKQSKEDEEEDAQNNQNDKEQESQIQQSQKENINIHQYSLEIQEMYENLYPKKQYLQIIVDNSIQTNFQQVKDVMKERILKKNEDKLMKQSQEFKEQFLDITYSLDKIYGSLKKGQFDSDDDDEHLELAEEDRKNLIKNQLRYQYCNNRIQSVYYNDFKKQLLNQYEGLQVPHQKFVYQKINYNFIKDKHSLQNVEVIKDKSVPYKKYIIQKEQDYIKELLISQNQIYDPSKRSQMMMLSYSDNIEYQQSIQKFFEKGVQHGYESKKLILNIQNDHYKIKVDYPAIDVFNLTRNEEYFKDFIQHKMYSFLNGTKYDYLNYNIWNFTLYGQLFAFRRLMIRLVNNPFFDNFIIIIVNFVILDYFQYDTNEFKWKHRLKHNRQ